MRKKPKRKSKSDEVWNLVPNPQRYWIDGGRWVAVERGNRAWSIIPIDALTPEDIARLRSEYEKRTLAPQAG